MPLDPQRRRTMIWVVDTRLMYTRVCDKKEIGSIDAYSVRTRLAGSKSLKSFGKFVVRD